MWVVNTQGQLVHTYVDPSGQMSVTYSIVVGPDGNVWVTGAGATINNPQASFIARITPSGAWTDYELPNDTNGSLPFAIASDSAGNNLWFTIQGRGAEQVPDRLGRFHI